MTDFNLPPGVNVSDLPGNRPEDSRWEEFDEWAMKELSELPLREAYWAVRMGIAAVKAQREDLDKMLLDIRAEAFRDGIENELG